MEEMYHLHLAKEFIEELQKYMKEIGVGKLLLFLVDTMLWIGIKDGKECNLHIMQW